MAFRPLKLSILALVAMLAFGACGKKNKPDSQASSTPTTVRPDSDSSFGSEEFVSAPVPQEPMDSDLRVGSNRNDAIPADALSRIHFEYDRSVITPESRRILEQNASFLRGNPGVRVEVGGHCDERGSTDYNIALGERRAQSAYRFMVDLGISSSRLRVVSYGEDQPLSMGNSEYDFALNRRVEFRPIN